MELGTSSSLLSELLAGCCCCATVLVVRELPPEYVSSSFKNRYGILLYFTLACHASISVHLFSIVLLRCCLYQHQRGDGCNKVGAFFELELGERLGFRLVSDRFGELEGRADVACTVTYQDLFAALALSVSCWRLVRWSLAGLRQLRAWQWLYPQP